MRRMKRQALKSSYAKSGNDFKSKTGKAVELEEHAIPWMAPEMLEGGAGGQSSDVFSFHVLMYEMITGNPPHIEKTMQEIIQFVGDKKRLELPTEEQLIERWEEIIHQQSRKSHGHVRLASTSALLASDRIAHKPLPPANDECISFRDLYTKCHAANATARPKMEDIADNLADLLLELDKEIQLDPVTLESTLEAARKAERENELAKSKPRQRPSFSLAKGLSTKLLDNEEGDDDDDDDDENNNEPTLEELCSVPCVLVNLESRRKLFAQETNKAWDLLGNAHARGFGAGPEAHTFDDNRWWLLPQVAGSSLTFVIENAHSGRRLYSQSFDQMKAVKPEKGIGAVRPVAGEPVWPETRWVLEPHRVPDEPTSYVIRNTGSDRALYARLPRMGEKWHVGVGAASLPPKAQRGNRSVPLTMQWEIIPQWGMGHSGFGGSFDGLTQGPPAARASQGARRAVKEAASRKSIDDKEAADANLTAKTAEVARIRSQINQKSKAAEDNDELVGLEAEEKVALAELDEAKAAVDRAQQKAKNQDSQSPKSKPQPRAKRTSSDSVRSARRSRDSVESTGSGRNRPQPKGRKSSGGRTENL